MSEELREVLDKLMDARGRGDESAVSFWTGALSGMACKLERERNALIQLTASYGDSLERLATVVERLAEGQATLIQQLKTNRA